MTCSKLTGFLLLTCAFVIAAPAPSGAQLGGLIKKKVVEGAKKATGTETPDENNKPANPNAAEPQSRNDPNVIPITEASLAAFERGLDTEIRLQEEYKAELAALQAQSQPYQACLQKVAISPEAMEINQQLGKLPENPKPEDVQNAMIQQGKDREALVLKRCGEDPAKKMPSGAARDARLTEIQQKAAAAARPIR